MGDGSVRSVSLEIEIDEIYKLGARNDGLVLDDSE
jgi:hypothetical protein